MSSEPSAVNATAVVCLAASAGGLEPLKQFLSATSPSTGLAFIVIMHLSPDRRSMLPELLSRSTRMKVVAGEAGLPLVPDTVTVLPAGTEMVVEGGRLREADSPDGTEAGPHTIDRFLTALADEFGSRVAAVILSGAGDDGAGGAAAVRRAGGEVLVQEPRTAAFPDMPSNAASAAGPDGVLRVEEMPARVAAFFRRVSAPAQEAAGEDEQLAGILRLVKATTGHDFSSYKTDTVMRRLERRMAMNDSVDLAAYATLLLDNPEEAEALYRDILIGVTSFFRDGEAFGIMEEKVLPLLLARRGEDGPVRIWHSCCATGEEVYSMAILVREYLDAHDLELPVQFFATDIDEAAVATARAGRYPASVAADIGRDRLATWFTLENGQYRAVKQLRDMIVFARHSLIKDPPFSRLDLLVCRNFLIYLNQAMQQRLIPLFHQVLRPEGFLFLGSSETVGRYGDLFTAVDKKWKIFRRNPGSPNLHALFPLDTSVRVPHLVLPVQSPRGEEASPAAAVEKLLMEQFFPSCAVVNERFEVVYFSNMTSRFLLQQVGEPSRDILRMVRRELRPSLRAGVHQALGEQRRVDFSRIKVEADGELAVVSLHVTPMPRVPGHNLARIVFQVDLSPAEPDKTLADLQVARAEETDADLVQQLEEQLRVTHEQLQATIEQLETSNEGFMSINEELVSTNEELQSANEELQSANEELETSKEELQTLNEELVTVNAELREKVAELDDARTDMENVFASSGIATIFLDPQLMIRTFSPAMAEMCNLLPGDVGRPFRHIACTFDWSTLDADAQKALTTLETVEAEVTDTTGARHYLKRILPYRNPAGEVTGVAVTLVDITDRKKIEERTKHLASFPELNPNPVLELAPTGQVIYANPASRRVLETLGLDPSATEAFLPSDLDLLLRHFACRSEGTYYREVRIRDRIFGATVHLVPQFGLVRIYALDITTGKRSEERYERIAATVPAVLYDYEILPEGEGRFLYLSPRCRDLFETDAGDLVADTTLFWNMVQPEDRTRLRERDRAVFFGNPASEEVRVTTPSGKRKWLEFTARPNAAEPGELPVFSGVILDISDRKRAEEEREKSDRLEALGVLAGGIAHDFNNILTAIIGNISLARRSVGEHPSAAQLASCEKAMGKATDLARQLLTFARGGEPVMRVVDAELLIHEVASFALHGSNIRAIFDLPSGLWSLHADAGQLHQALNNLLINALQAMPAGGTVCLSAANEEVGDGVRNLPRGRYVRITVSDTGCGIDAAILGKIFDPYFTTKTGGTGLGLASVFSIVRRHGGAVEVTSIPGRGTDFTILLPAADGVPDESPPDDAEAAPAPVAGVRILVMDDEEMIREIVGEMLEELGYSGVTCADGAEAVELYRRHAAEGNPFAAVILDVTVPGGMGGLEAAERLRQLDPGATLILSTGYSVETVQGGAGSVFAAMVAKPYNLQQLARELSKVVRTG